MGLDNEMNTIPNTKIECNSRDEMFKAACHLIENNVVSMIQLYTFDDECRFSICKWDKFNGAKEFDCNQSHDKQQYFDYDNDYDYDYYGY